MRSVSGANGLARADELAELGNRLRDYVTAPKVLATLRAYRADWRAFSSRCDERGLDPLPAAPETVAAT